MREVFDRETINSSGYVVSNALEFDWSKGKSWKEKRQSTDKSVKRVATARIKWNGGDN